MAKIDEFFRMMAEHGASDLHLISGQPPALRIHGELERITGKAPLTTEILHDMLFEIAPGSKKDLFESTGDVDFGYEIPGLARFRSNFFNHKYGVGAVFRKIPSKVLTAEELGLPPILTRAAMLKKGLVLVTGPTGSGKSTTNCRVTKRSPDSITPTTRVGKSPTGCSRRVQKCRRTGPSATTPRNSCSP